MSGNVKRPSGEEILRFLNAHRLDHSPTNYAFAHRFLFETDPVLRREVERITDGGVRITPEEVTKLAGVGVGAGIAVTGQDNARELDRLTVRILDIIGDAVLATGDFNRDLVGAAAALVRPEGFDLPSVVAAMIDRTERAEAHLAEATRQAQTLREELNALRDHAGRDGLTGLVSRVGADELLGRSVAAPGGCSVALIDVDRFRRINDEHGHAVGDRVLQAVATELAGACKPHVVARWGGEEFLVLMDGLTAAEAATVIARVKGGLSLRHLKVRESDALIGSVSISAGVASSRGRDAASLIAEAGALLAAAKAAGGNRIEREAIFVGVPAKR